jgi:hypothetical protein
MKGYCAELKQMVEMSDVQTIQLPNLDYIHKGKYIDPAGKVHTITRAVMDNEIIRTGSGNHYPKEVFIGNSTPKKIINNPAGQRLIVAGQVFETSRPDGTIKTVEEVKTEVLKNESLFKNDAAVGGVDVRSKLIRG